MPSNRPLSPHLQIYRWQLTSVMSILHRMTGVALSVGTLYLAFWLVSIALGPAAYQTAVTFARSPFGLFLLLGWTAALYYHLFNGVRHLIWDTGYLFQLKNAYAAGYAVLILTALATGLTWYYAHAFG